MVWLEKMIMMICKFTNVYKVKIVSYSLVWNIVNICSICRSLEFSYLEKQIILILIFYTYITIVLNSEWVYVYTFLFSSHVELTDISVSLR